MGVLGAEVFKVEEVALVQGHHRGVIHEKLDPERLRMDQDRARVIPAEASDFAVVGRHLQGLRRHGLLVQCELAVLFIARADRLLFIDTHARGVVLQDLQLQRQVDAGVRVAHVGLKARLVVINRIGDNGVGRLECRCGACHIGIGAMTAAETRLSTGLEVLLLHGSDEAIKSKPYCQDEG